MLNTKQKIGMGVALVGATMQCVSELVILKEYKRQGARYKELHEEHLVVVDIANKSLYIAAYLNMILGRNGVELTDFDKQVLSDPPGIYNDDIPTLFQQVMDNPDFLEKLIEDPADEGESA